MNTRIILRGLRGVYLGCVIDACLLVSVINGRKRSVAELGVKLWGFIGIENPLISRSRGWGR